MLIRIYSTNIFQQTVIDIDLVLMMFELLLQRFQFIGSKTRDFGFLPQSIQFFILKETLIFVSFFGIVEFL